MQKKNNLIIACLWFVVGVSDVFIFGVNNNNALTPALVYFKKENNTC